MAGSVKYLRYIVFALLSLTLIFFISSSSEIPRQTYNNAAELLKGGTSQFSDVAEADSELKVEPPKQTTIPKLPTSPQVNENDLLSSEVEDTPPVLDTSPNPKAGSSAPGTKLGGPATAARMNATFVTLARNEDVWEISRSIRQVEDRFNWQFGYDWIFLNDQPFDETFKTVTTALTSGKAKYGLIKKEEWSFPEWIDQEKAAATRAEMEQKKVIYGASVSYRHMCRYESGFFFRHELLLDYEWYWRVEPSIELFCDVNYDVFKFMADNKKKYSFTLSLFEYVETIQTLWESTRKFIKAHPEHIAADNSMEFLSDDGGYTYNRCHFWSNFEIGNLNWLRSKPYIDFFSFLDQEGGFFYERWGDAPVHSIAAGLLLDKSEIHFFNDIAYYHVPFTHCPSSAKQREELKCHCNPSNNFDWNGYSCTKKWHETNQMPLPDGYNGPS